MGCSLLSRVFAFLSNAVCRCLVSLLRVAFGCCVHLLASLSHLVSLHSWLIVPLFLSFLVSISSSVAVPCVPCCVCFLIASLRLSSFTWHLWHLVVTSLRAALMLRPFLRLFLSPCLLLVSFLPCPLCRPHSLSPFVLSRFLCPVVTLLLDAEPAFSWLVPAASALLCCVQPGGVSPFLAPSAFSSPVSGFFHPWLPCSLPSCSMLRPTFNSLFPVGSFFVCLLVVLLVLLVLLFISSWIIRKSGRFCWALLDVD